jgi:dipeptidyl aminopeptidase/acylaminoacyl peptidase
MIITPLGSPGDSLSNSPSPHGDVAMTKPMGKECRSMPHLMRLMSLSLLFVSCAVPAFAQERRMTPELLWKLGRLGEAAVSADGTHVAYSVRTFELEKNQGATSVYLLNLESGEQKTLLDQWPGVGDLQFVGQADEERLYFTGRPTEEIAEQHAQEESTTSPDSSENGESKENSELVWPQIWAISLVSGKREQLSHLEQPVANLKVSPTGSHVAFTLRVQLEPETKDLFPDLPLADARIIDGLMFRHWDRWHDGKYSHLHVAELDDAGQVGTLVDLMRGIRADSPLPPFGGSRQIAWAPDGREIAYTAKIVNNWAQSTNSSIYVCSLDNDDLENDELTTRCITTGMEGYDTEPLYSPDGRWIAFHSMERPGFEADRNRIMLYARSTGEIHELTVGLDQTTHRATWLPDSNAMLFYSERLGTDQIFRIELGKRGATQVTSGQWNWSIVDVLPGGEQLLVTVQDMIRPSELAIVSLSDGEFRRVTRVNDEHYEGLTLPTVKQRWVRSSDGAMVHCWVIYPPTLTPNRNGRC